MLATAQAQDLEPRSYANTPVGINFLLLGYGYMTGGVSTDPAIPLEGAELEVHTSVLGYARSLDLWGHSGKFDIIVPAASLAGSAMFAGQPRERSIAGLGDPKFRFSVNLYGAPALTLAEFPDFRQDLIIGASLQVSAPLGQYDPNKLVNLGTNRWYVKPQLGLSKRFGQLTLELMGDATFYSDNDEFLGQHTRSQDPLYGAQGHLIYSFRSGVWCSLDGTYYTGGSTTVDGVANHDLQENTRLGASVSLPLARNYSVKLYASTGVSTRTGGSFDLAGLAFQYVFGGGL